MGIEFLYTGISLFLLCLYGIIIAVFTVGLCLTEKNAAIAQSRYFPISPFRYFTISIIIPVRNEQAHVVRILEEMKNQDYPVDLMEVIVSDDSSDDDTMVLTSRYYCEHPSFPLVMVNSDGLNISKSGKKQTIIRAIVRAKGEIVICTDADTWHSTSWVKTMVNGFKQKEIKMVLGPVVFRSGNNLLQKVQAIEFLGITGATCGSATIGYPVMCNGANLGYRRCAFVEVGGYSSNLNYASGDDQFLMSSVRKRFGKGSIIFLYDSLAIVQTEAERTLIGFLHQRFRWVSKSPGYRDRGVIIVGAVTWLTISILFCGMVLGIFFRFILLIAVILWFVKMGLDYPIIRIMLRFSEKREKPGYYIISQLFQLIYVPVVSLIGLFFPYRWKGRRG
ncbi:MAG: glycosyltransferase [Bacteroidetes bacterium]|nr:glycosyltransferase [Bacteroidota bacterium]